MDVKCLHPFAGKVEYLENTVEVECVAPNRMTEGGR